MQAAKVLASHDPRVAEDLRGRPDQHVVDRQPQQTDGFALRPARIAVFGAATGRLLQDALDVSNGSGFGEGGFVEFHVKLFLQGA